MSLHYGFSITATRQGPKEHPAFLSGEAVSRGRFRSIMPLKQGDFVPIWERTIDAQVVLDRLKSSPACEGYDFDLVDIRLSIESGGLSGTGTGLFRSVGGWVVPIPDRQALLPHWKSQP